MSALVEKDLEQSIAALFANIQGAKIITAWGSVPQGEVKDELTPAAGVVISIAAAPPQYDAFTVPSCSIAVAVVVEIRRETAPDGAALAAAIEPIAAVLNGLQANVENVAALSSESFDADGARLDGGQPPTFVTTANVWRVVRSFTIRGVVKESVK